MHDWFLDRRQGQAWTFFRLFSLLHGEVIREPDAHWVEWLRSAQATLIVLMIAFDATHGQMVDWRFVCWELADRLSSTELISALRSLWRVIIRAGLLLQPFIRSGGCLWTEYRWEFKCCLTMHFPVLLVGVEGEVWACAHFLMDSAWKMLFCAVDAAACRWSFWKHTRIDRFKMRKNKTNYKKSLIFFTS